MMRKPHEFMTISVTLTRVVRSENCSGMFLPHRMKTEDVVVRVTRGKPELLGRIDLERIVRSICG